LKATAAVRIGRINGEFVVMPTIQEMEDSDLDLIVSGTRDAITMIEGFARELAEDQMLAAINLAHHEIKRIIDLIEELRDKAGLGAKVFPPDPAENPLKAIFEKRFAADIRTAKQTTGKKARADAVHAVKEKIVAEFLPAENPQYTA